MHQNPRGIRNEYRRNPRRKRWSDYKRTINTLPCLGSYVRYQGDVWVVTKTLNNVVTLYRVSRLGYELTKVTGPNNLVLLPDEGKGKFVKLDGVEYLITPRGTVIDTSTNRKVSDEAIANEVLKKGNKALRVDGE